MKFTDSMGKKHIDILVAVHVNKESKHLNQLRFAGLIDVLSFNFGLILPYPESC